MLAYGIARDAGIGKPLVTSRIRSSERCNTSSGPFCESRAPFSDATRPRAFHGASSPSGHSTMSTCPQSMH
jgi:hypothetical protein